MIKVAIFDDNVSRLESLRMLLDGIEKIDCVGIFKDCTHIDEKIESCQPDVVLMDIDMPLIDGIEGTLKVKEHSPEVKVIIQTVFEDENRIIGAICAGADGYILKQKSPIQLVEGIQEVVEGGAPMTPVVARKVLKIFSRNNTVPSTNISLTRREKEVLSLLVDGYSYKMIADKCSISYATVNTHISHIYEKLQVNSVAGAVSRALRENLI